MNDFDKAAKELAKQAVDVLPSIRAAIQFGANTVKQTWRERAIQSSGAHARQYPYKITYDTRILATSVVAEIGPVAEEQGELGPVLEFGSQHTPPTLDGLRSLTDAEPRVTRAVDLAVAFGARGIFG